MAWVKQINTDDGILGLWELNDTLDELLSKFHFSIAEKELFNKMIIEKRKKEFLSVRLLTEQLLHSKPDIIYNPEGRPALKNSALNISISHSNELVAVYLSHKNIGIDVENLERNIEKIASRFLSEDEIKFAEKQEDVRATMIFFWSAKEAVFKCAGKAGILFNNQIRIDTDTLKNNNYFYAELLKENKNRRFLCCKLFFKNNVVVYCVEEEKLVDE